MARACRTSLRKGAQPVIQVTTSNRVAGCSEGPPARVARRDGSQDFKIAEMERSSLRYQDEIVALEDAWLAASLARLDLDRSKFHGHLGNRRVMSFGLVLHRYRLERLRLARLDACSLPTVLINALI